jgi:AP2 domain
MFMASGRRGKSTTSMATSRIIANLRLATRSQNKANTARYSNNSTGFKGVERTPYGRFKASIRKDRKPYYLGTFGDPREAHAAYDRAAREMFGEFANAGTLTFQSSTS